MPKLTKRVVEAAKPDPGRDLFLWDTQLPGFGLRVFPSGKRKYILQYRTKTNRQRRYVIGPHGVLTTEKAREKAHDLLGQVHDGGDPAADARAAREAPTVADLAADYLQRHAVPNKRPSSVRNDRSMLDHLILPRLGKVKVAAVTRRDIEAIHTRLRTTPYRANRVLALVSKMLNLAVAWGWRGDNPARGIPRYHEDRRERWLSAEELSRLWATLDGHANQRAANAIKLMVLTGARRGEVLGATWGQFDLDRGIWTKPSHHTKEKRTEHVPLSKPALALLSTLRGKAKAADTYLFPGNTPRKPNKDKETPLQDIKKAWREIRGAATLALWRDIPKAAKLIRGLAAKLDRDPTTAEVRQAAKNEKITLPKGLEDVRLHDLRHTYASSLVSRGVSLHIVGRLLGHTQPQTTARYAHLDDDALRAATDGFGEALKSTRGKDKARVVPINAKR